jgi:hypothetical protein
MLGDEMLPCHREWQWGLVPSRKTAGRR